MEALKNPDVGAEMIYSRDDKGGIIAEEKDEVPGTKEEGRDRWRKEMELRFIRGDDGDFDYDAVDKNEDFDDRTTMDRDHEEEWFEGEDPQWVSSEKDEIPTGQTGVQDY